MATAGTRVRYDGLDSVALIELVRHGDNDAYGELFVRYHDFARRVARRASRRHADDLVAESFRRVLTAISRGAGPTHAFGPYLATTIRSAAAGLAAPFQEIELDVSDVLTEEPGDVDPRVSTAFAALPESWQNALWYADVEGLAPRQAAPLLGLPSANAFSALRTRARAGLRSAYLTQVVDDVCNEEVRHHLELLMAGDVDPDTVDAVVDEHLAECDECAAIAWRVAAVTGAKLPMTLAPAIVAVLGFGAHPALLPSGLGAPALVTWIRRPSSAQAAAVAAAVLMVLALLIGLAFAAANSGDGAAPVADVPGPESVPVSPPPASPPPADAGEGAGDPEPASEASPSTSTTTPTSTATPTSTTTPTTDDATSTASSAPPIVTVPPGAPVRVSPAPTLVIPTTPPSPARVAPATVATTTSVAILPPLPSTTSAPVASTTTNVPPPTPTTTSTTTSPPPPPTTTTTSTTTTTTTTTTTSTTTTTTTTVPPTPPGDLIVVRDEVVGSKRRVELRVVDLTGAAGTLEFSGVSNFVQTINATCAADSCALGGVVSPAVVHIELQAPTGPITIDVRDSAGTIVESYTSP